MTEDVARRRISIDAKPGARAIAARVLERVERDRAFAAATLDAELDRHLELDPRDRALATELVYGCLRTRQVLIDRLARFATRGLKHDDVKMMSELIVAAYQLLLLERVPAHAAVDQAVSAIKRLRGARVAGFANALLRKLAASGERLDPRTAIYESAPGWLRARLEAAIGREETLALLGADGAPQTVVRIIERASLPDWLKSAPRGRLSPLARLVSGGDPRKREGYAEGAFIVQEEGAQLIALAVGARPGERVLDACSGRGQKASLLAERIAPGGELWATDVHPAKLRALEQELERLRLRSAHIAAVDWTVGSGPVPDGFDRVLVDAPCSGVGTLRRRPEIALRLTPEDPERLGELAARILRGAGARARLGGRVVYSVCSVLPEECERVVEEVSDLLEPIPFDAAELAGIASAEMTAFRLLPLRHGTDGYFVASFVRR